MKLPEVGVFAGGVALKARDGVVRAQDRGHLLIERPIVVMGQEVLCRGQRLPRGVSVPWLE